MQRGFGNAIPTGLTIAEDPEDADAPEYVFRLPDGVESRFRYMWTDGRPHAALRVPNRTIAPTASLRDCAARVATAFAEPHSVLEFHDDARGAFLGFQTCLNVQANAAAQVRRVSKLF